MRSRRARFSDRTAVEALTNRARYSSPPLWRWETHLADEAFLLVENGDAIHGALFASADASPVAWTRLAAVDAELDPRQWLELSLPPILRVLRNRGVHELAWMDDSQWAHTFLRRRGFRPVVEVITLAKSNRHIPDEPAECAVEPTAPGIALRSTTDADIGEIARIDRAAFEPYWWRSEATLRRRAAAASQFTVADCGGQVIGYTEGELHLPGAHLNRIAIHPRVQGRGVGAVLLTNVLNDLWRSGARTVSLNTQRHNRRSRHLYELFGFKPTGEVATVWTLHLIAPRIPTATSPASGVA